MREVSELEVAVYFRKCAPLFCFVRPASDSTRPFDQSVQRKAKRKQRNRTELRTCDERARLDRSGNVTAISASQGRSRSEAIGLTEDSSSWRWFRQRLPLSSLPASPQQLLPSVLAISSISVRIERVRLLILCSSNRPITAIQHHARPLHSTTTQLQPI